MTMEEQIKQAVESLGNIRGNPQPQTGTPDYSGRIHGVAERHRQREELHNTPTVMTAPEVIKAIEGLHERLRTLQGVAYELASELVGTQTYPQGRPDKEPTPPRNVFERMGIELLATTHTLDAIDRDIHACLVAVRP